MIGRRKEVAGWIGRRQLNVDTGFLWRRGPVEGSPARELEPTAAYRLGIDIEGGWRSHRNVTGWDNP
jgi:hypothetical protein